MTRRCGRRLTRGCGGARPGLALVTALLLTGAPRGAGARGDLPGGPALDVSLVDPAGDDHGPGSYSYPLDARLPSGSLDITSLQLSPKGDDLEVRACFRVRPRRVEGVHVSRYESQNLFPEVVDIYLDTTPGEGLEEALPGRAVRMEPTFAWDRVLVLMERAPVFRTWLGHVAPEMNRRLVTQRSLTVTRRCLVGRMALALTGRPQPGWGVLAVVTGARFYPTFRIGDRLAGSYRTDEFTRDVQLVPGFCGHQDDRTFDCAFGGCAPCGGHPRVIDALGCRADASALAGYDGEAGRLATLAGVRLDAAGAGVCPPAAPSAGPAGEGAEPPAPEAPAGSSQASALPTSGGKGHRIAAVSEEVVTVVGAALLPVGALLEVVAGGSGTGARLVVTGHAGPVSLAQTLSGSDGLTAGQTVRLVGARPPTPPSPTSAPATTAPAPPPQGGTP